jgi:hypothetical protein
VISPQGFIENTYKLLNTQVILGGDMKLRHKANQREMHLGKRVAGFVGMAVLTAGLMFAGCDKRGGLTPAPEPNNRQMSEAVECSKTVTSTKGAKRLLSEVHNKTILLSMDNAIAAEPGETVRLTWKLRVEDNGQVNLVGIDANCESGSCIGLDAHRIKSSLPNIKIEAPSDDCGWRWDIRTIIESQRSKSS